MRYQWIVLVLVLLVLGGCGDGEVATTSTAAPPTTATATAPPTTALPTTKIPATTTTVPACDPATALNAFEQATVAARLAVTDAVWTTDTTGSAYVEAVVSPDRFADSLGFRCSLLAVQAVGSDHERLGLAAWTGERMGYVILAIDQPTTPYAEAVRFDLLFEQPWGEWVTDTIWAVTISTGDAVIVAAEDYFHGPVAKSFLVAFPEPPSPPPGIPAEEYAMAALEAAGATNIGIAEPSATDVASIAFSTPLGNPMIATVGPITAFDPFTGYLSGERTISVVDGLGVHTVLPGPDQFGVADVSFVCGDHGWRLEASVGTPDEPFDMAVALIETLACGE
jgi:hypothetical protein